MGTRIARSPVPTARITERMPAFPAAPSTCELDLESRFQLSSCTRQEKNLKSAMNKPDGLPQFSAPGMSWSPPSLPPSWPSSPQPCPPPPPPSPIGMSEGVARWGWTIPPSTSQQSGTGHPATSRRIRLWSFIKAAVQLRAAASKRLRVISRRMSGVFSDCPDYHSPSTIVIQVSVVSEQISTYDL